MLITCPANLGNVDQNESHVQLWLTLISSAAELEALSEERNCGWAGTTSTGSLSVAIGSDREDPFSELADDEPVGVGVVQQLLSQDRRMSPLS